MKSRTTILKFLNSNLLSILFVLLAVISIYVSKRQDVNIVFLNVGQGDAILFQEDDFQILVDGGPDDSVLYELPKYMPLLDNTIEVLVLTHAHDDHILGLLEVLENYNVQTILYSPSCNKSEAYDFMIKNYTDILKEVDNTTKLDYGNIHISVLYPIKQECMQNINDESIVLDIQFRDKLILLMGDAEKEVEERILESFRDIDILKAGHHCSDTASSDMFLTKTKPELAICSCGEENKFGHPHNETLENFRRHNVQYLITYIEGNIVIE